MTLNLVKFTAMKNFPAWAYVIVAVGVAVLANSISAIWAKQDDKFSYWLLAVLLISPFVFITFGLVTQRAGVAIASGVVDSLLTLTTIAVGLVLFQEWSKISSLQYLGMAMALAGVFLMLFYPKPGT